MKKDLSKLFELRQALNICEKDFGLDHLSEVEKAVFSFITSNENVTITSIRKHPYFKRYSISTIKRAVLYLLNNDFIESKKSKTDAREMYLTHSI